MKVAVRMGVEYPRAFRTDHLGEIGFRPGIPIMSSIGKSRLLYPSRGVEGGPSFRDGSADHLMCITLLLLLS